MFEDISQYFRILNMYFLQDKSSQLAEKFLSTAGLIDDHPFAIVSDEKVLADASVAEDKVVLYKKVT